MRYSQSFLRTTRETPKEAELVSHQYLVRGGYVTPLAAGIYSLLPLGFRVQDKIIKIIQEELRNIGVEDMLMPVVQPGRIWKESGRFLEIGPELWKIQNRSEEDFVLAMTHEEVVTDAAKKVIKSHKDLPKLVGQIQTKVRDEARPRGGLLRLREFMMQDAYSFDKDEAEQEKIYKKFIEAYTRIFERVGVKTLIIESDTGAMGGSGAHEFMMIAESGEDWILSIEGQDSGMRYINGELLKGINKDSSAEAVKKAFIEQLQPSSQVIKVEQLRGIEVGNIFKLGTKYSAPMKLTYLNEKNEQVPVVMGSYGIGVDRLIAAIVEASHDDKGIIWPTSVAPYLVHLVVLGSDHEVVHQADKVYHELVKKGIEVFYDDREDVSAGGKFADADLLGIPYRVTVSAKTVEQKSAEVKARNAEAATLIELSKVADTVKP